MRVTGNIVTKSLSYSSDRSLKTDIVALDHALENILSLNGYAFTWKDSGKKDIGVIAQEVEKVYPDLVRTDATTGLKSVEYGNLIAPMIEAMKSQQKLIDAQNTRIKSLESEVAKIKSLETRIQRLEGGVRR